MNLVHVGSSEVWVLRRSCSSCWLSCLFSQTFSYSFSHSRRRSHDLKMDDAKTAGPVHATTSHKPHKRVRWRSTSVMAEPDTFGASRPRLQQEPPVSTKRALEDTKNGRREDGWAGQRDYQPRAAQAGHGMLCEGTFARPNSIVERCPLAAQTKVKRLRKRYKGKQTILRA